MIYVLTVLSSFFTYECGYECLKSYRQASGLQVSFQEYTSEKNCKDEADRLNAIRMGNIQTITAYCNPK